VVLFDHHDHNARKPVVIWTRSWASTKRFAFFAPSMSLHPAMSNLKPIALDSRKLAATASLTGRQKVRVLPGIDEKYRAVTTTTSACRCSRTPWS